MRGDIEAVFMGTKEMKADVLTKAFAGPMQEAGARALGLCEFQSADSGGL